VTPTAADTGDMARVAAALQQRWPESMPQPSLSRVAMLVDLLGAPQRAYPVIHLTGTNGKTSTARMIDALLRAFGVRVGRYTSPHLQAVNERIAIDGVPISDERFVATYDDIAPYVELVDQRSDTTMSTFEVLTAMAFAAFADTPVDVAVVEVGLGGSWDATNVADGRVAVVTPIGMDHAALLGDTLAEIASEKAGIVKAEATLIAAAQEIEAAEVLLRKAAEVGAVVAREGLEWGVLDRAVAVGGQLVRLQGLGGIYDEIFLPLHGAHQAQNAATALAAVEAFFGAGGTTGAIDIDAVRAGFSESSSPGRLEAVRSAPTVLLDAAHNPAGMAATVQALSDGFDFRRLIGVVAVLGDKDVLGILAALEPVLDAVVVTANSSPRALPVDDLAALAAEVFGEERIVVEPRMDDALETAIGLAEEQAGDGPLAGAGVLVTGSVVTAGDARALLA